MTAEGLVRDRCLLLLPGRELAVGSITRSAVPNDEEHDHRNRGHHCEHDPSSRAGRKATRIARRRARGVRLRRARGGDGGGRSGGRGCAFRNHRLEPQLIANLPLSSTCASGSTATKRVHDPIPSTTIRRGRVEKQDRSGVYLAAVPQLPHLYRHILTDDAVNKIRQALRVVVKIACVGPPVVQN